MNALQRESPGGDSQAPSEVIAATNHSLPYETAAVVDGAPAVLYLDAARQRAESIARRLLTSTRGEREAYYEGRADGYVDGEAAGFHRGYRTCDDEISTLQREAAKVVQAMVRLPEVGTGSRGDS